jgi:hypothetical protein
MLGRENRKQESEGERESDFVASVWRSDALSEAEVVRNPLLWGEVIARKRGGHDLSFGRCIIGELGTIKGQTLLKTFLELIEHDGKDDDEPGNNLLPEFLDTKEDESIGEDAND